MEERAANKTGPSEPVPDFDGRYRDVELIAERGLASAFAATDAQTGERVFLKILRESKLDDPHAFRLFCQEPALLQRLAHDSPHIAIAPILETGYWRERPLFTQPFLTGWSLDKVMRKRPVFNGPSVMKVITGCLRFLETLHNVGLVHGDISPDNIFIETDAPMPEQEGCLPEQFSVRLLDFNSVRRIDEPKLSRTGRNIIFLKLPYAAPELAAGYPLSVQSDLYALGVVFFEMLVGARPHHEPQTIEDVAKLKDVAVPRIPDALEVPTPIEQIVRKLLAKNQEHRFPSAAECLGALLHLAAQRYSESMNRWLSNTEAPRPAKHYFLPPARQQFVTGSYEHADPAPFLSELGQRGGQLVTRETVTEKHPITEQVPDTFIIREMEGMRRTWELPTNGRLSMGRAPDNDIRIDDLRASRHHAEIYFNPDGYAEIVNVSLGNPIIASDRQVNHSEPGVRLHDGDRIQIAATHFQVSHERQAQSIVHTGAHDYSVSLISMEVSMAHAVPVPDSEHEIELVDFSVFAPGVVAPGSSFILEIWAYLSERREEVLQRAGRHGRLIERGSRGPVYVAGRSELTLVLRLDDFEIQDSQDTFFWSGDITNVPFIIRTPPGLKPGIYPGQVNVLHGGMPLTRLIFELTVGKKVDEQANLNLRREEFKTAFASYASEDRDEVLRCVQGIRITGVDVFLDVLSLRAAQRWEAELFNQITARDIFYLFWSVAASRSKWVDREWRYALRHKGLDFIYPIPLVTPEEAPPPSELSSKHFNDMLLACIKSRAVFSATEQTGRRAGSSLSTLLPSPPDS